MLRDSKLSRRSSAKTSDLEELENVPINPNDSSSNSSYPDSSSRAPLHSIPDPIQNPKQLIVEHEVTSSKPKFERTPVKSRANTPSFLLRTPERQGFGIAGKNRFGFSSLNESRDEARSEMSNYIGQSTRNHSVSLNLTPRVAGKPAASTSTYSETTTTSTQVTPTKSVSKPPNPAYLYSSSRYPGNGSARAANYSALSRGLGGSGAPPCVVNTIDVAHFDLKEDPSFWMDHNVQVIIRVRPLNGNERSMYGFNRCVRQESAQSISWIGQPETRFTFDHVACETVDQEMLFRMAGLPMVENCLSGYNSCMFAYGQTGSGKTYTMLGEMEDVEFTPSPHRGMTPRIFEFLFARMRAEEESRSDEKLQYSCKCSFLEIYNEQITDLLDPSSTNLLLREDVKKGVYVENLSEFEVHTVGDVLQLLIQGSSNRKVAATNMNRESSRSHCVFICIIESKWERDSVTNYRFARLNLVDLAGSERQKSSGAEGERLKEAANINKSLSTLGHVIMLLVDIAHGKARHVPYRDSRLTFLLQDSLGGNAKTMIIANVSSSICCAAETLNTLKFAQRAKLIQNNAVVNEDSSGDVAVLQQQIWFLKEELSNLKRQNVSRTLAFDTSCSMRSQENHENETITENDQLNREDLLESESKGGVRVSSKQLKSVEMMLTGALRREQMAERSMRQLEAEIEKLNCLVRQREEDTRCSKMKLKFREDKMQRMESLLEGLKPVDAYLLEENAALSEEIKMLQAKVDRNPEVTRFALENIRLMEQLRRFQDFYEEGERDLLMNEVSELRAQLIRFHDSSMQQHVVSNTAQDSENDRKEHESLSSKLTITANELEECQTKLKSCLETNSKLCREIEELHAQLRNKDLELRGCHEILTSAKDVEVPHCPSQAFDRVVDENIIHTDLVTAEELVNLELELDILKIILKEEKLSRCKMEELASSLTRDVQMAEQQILLISKQREDAEADLVEAKSVIQALESQQLLSLGEMEDLKNHNSHHLKLLHKQELQLSALKEQAYGPESTSCLKHSECEDSPLQEQVKRMQASLDKAKRLNMWYQNDHAYQKSNEDEMEAIRRQAEAETAEVIVCLQEELCVLQQRVDESDSRGKEAESKLLILETRLKELHDDFDILSHDNEALCQKLQEREVQLKLLVGDWELLSYEIEEALIEGHEALRSASDELDFASTSNRRGWVSDQMSKVIRLISDKQSLIEELNNCLEEANIRTNDMDRMLMSLRGAAIIMAESHQQECCDKEKEILQLRSELKTSLLAKKEELYMSEKNDLESIQAVEVGVFSLEAAFTDFEQQCQSKLLALNHKLNKLEEHAQKAKCSWHQKKELFDYEIGESKAAAAEKAVEASCILVRFEEVQDTMKEADMMINGLMIANETMKLEIEGLRNMHIMLTGERDSLVNEVHTLQSTNDLKDQRNNYLESQILLDASETASLIEELRSLVSVAQDASREAVMSLTHDFSFVKSQLQDTLSWMHSSLEEIWSEIVKKDCAVSVLHLCHIGILSEAAIGINSENGLLHHGMYESKALINDLRDENLKSKEEVEMYRSIKERLMSDINSGLDSILSKDNETRELNLKLDSFKENLAFLQRQEELMLETCDFMGSKLVMLEAELNKSNLTVAASVVEQEQFQKENAKLIESQAEVFSVELYAKDLEVSFMASELQNLAEHNVNMENQHQMCCTTLDSLVSEIVTCKIFSDLMEQLLLHKESEVDHLLIKVTEGQESESRVLAQLQAFEAENKTLKEHMSKKEIDLENLQNGMFLLQSSSHDIQSTLLKLEEENEALENRLLEVKSENCILLDDLQDKDSEIKSYKDFADTLESKNCKLQENISTLGSRIYVLEKDLETKRAELIDFQQLQSSTAETLSSNSQNLESYCVKLKGLQEGNLLLTDELQSLKQKSFETLGNISSKVSNSAYLVDKTELQNCRMIKQLEEFIMCVSDQMSKDSCQNIELVSNFLEELESIDYIAKEVVSQNLSLQEELLRKDELLNGLLFDLRLLQESAANCKDQQDMIEELEGILESTESDLATKSRELEEAVTFGKELETKVKEQGDIISATKMDIENANQSLKTVSGENEMLKSQVEDIMAARTLIERELCDKCSVIDSLENELLEMGNTLGQMNDLVESLKSNLDDVNSEKDQLQKELLILEGKLETAQALAGENEAIAAEAQQIAESRRLYAEEKEEEVQLLERSVQELDSTISVLENKVDVLKGEAERQRLQREELELELHSFRNQMQSVATADSEIKRDLDEKTKNLEETLSRVKVLEKDLGHRETEVAQCKTHISELSLHAEAQACEYKQKFKELEAMLEQFRAEEASNHERTVSCNKLDKNSSKGRGSASPFKAKGSSSPFKGRGTGSPFKCIGLGLAHQLKSEKDEEMNAERLRIEELEALAASRQKEIFALNARLATTESMTHDVMRDLLGVKLDMSTYANMLDKQQVLKLTEVAQLDSVESQDHEVDELKKQLNELIVERNGWLEEIDRRQSELMAAQIELEELRQQEQFLCTENNILKRDLTNHKRHVVELEGEVKKLSGQQNLQQRIHHHAKIKEENNMLKLHNEELSEKVRHAEAYLKRVKKGLSNCRGMNNGTEENRQNPRRMSSHATYFSAVER